MVAAGGLSVCGSGIVKLGTACGIRVYTLLLDAGIAMFTRTLAISQKPVLEVNRRDSPTQC